MENVYPVLMVPFTLGMVNVLPVLMDKLKWMAFVNTVHIIRSTNFPWLGHEFLLLSTGRGVLERGSAVGFCQEMAVVAAISQVKDCYKILKHIILPMYTN